MIISHYLQLLSHYRKLLLQIVITTTAAAFLISVLLLLVAPMYTGTASVVMLPTEAELTFTQGWVGNSQYHPANVMTQTQMEYLISRPVAEKTYEKLAAELAGMPQPTGFSAWLKDRVSDVQMGLMWAFNMANSGAFVKLSPYEDMLQKLRDGIEIEMVESSYILQISATLPDPRAASLAANTVAEAYDEMIAEQTAQANTAMQAYFEQELARQQTKLDDLTRREYDRREELGILSLDEERAYLQTARENERQALSAAQIQLATLRTRATALQDDEVSVTQSRIRSQLDEELAMQPLTVKQLEQTIGLRRANIDSLTAELDLLNTREEPILRLVREREAVERDIESLQARMMAVSLSTFAKLSQVRTVNPAEQPFYPSSPQVVVYTALGLAAGLFIAFFVLIAIDSLGGMVKTYADLHKVVGARAVGRIGPMMKAQVFGRMKRLLKGRDFLAGSLSEMLYGLDAGEGTAQAPLQVTGFDLKGAANPEGLPTLCAALAADGRPVVCAVPEPLNLPEVPKGFEGRILFVRSFSEGSLPGAIHLQARPDAAPWEVGRQAGNRASSVICLVQAGELSEERLADFETAQGASDKGGMRYVLMDS